MSGLASSRYACSRSASNGLAPNIRRAAGCATLLGLAALASAARAALPAAAPLHAPTTAEARLEEGKVVGIVSGDTLQVAYRDHVETVHLVGVKAGQAKGPDGAPEYFSREAYAFAKTWLEGQAVRLQREPRVPERDAQGRLERYVYRVDGDVMANAEIVRYGFAEADLGTGFAHRDAFKGFEREARGARRGLWDGSAYTRFQQQKAGAAVQFDLPSLPGLEWHGQSEDGSESWLVVVVPF